MSHIVLSPPDRLGAGLDGGERLTGGPRVPELDGGVVAAGGELVLVQVVPVDVVDAGHVCCHVAPCYGWFLGISRNRDEVVYVYTRRSVRINVTL